VRFEHVEAFLVQTAVENNRLELLAAKFYSAGLSKLFNPVGSSNIHIHCLRGYILAKRFLLLSEVQVS